MDKEFDSMKPILSFHNYANHMGKLQNSPMDYIDMVCQHIDKHIYLNIANDILFLESLYICYHKIFTNLYFSGSICFLY